MEWRGVRLTAKDAYHLFLAMKDDEKATRKALEAKAGRFAAETREVRNGGMDRQRFVINLISADKPEQNAVTLMCAVADAPENPSEAFMLLKTSLVALIAELCSQAGNDGEEKARLAAKVRRKIAEESGHSRKSFLFDDWLQIG
jgi:hypothetical protein